MTEQLTKDEKTALVAVAVLDHIYDGTGGLSVMTYINTQLLEHSSWNEWDHPDLWDWDRASKVLEGLKRRQLIILNVGWRICREGRKLL